MGTIVGQVNVSIQLVSRSPLFTRREHECDGLLEPVCLESSAKQANVSFYFQQL